jgi:hypothetical protein
MDASAIDVDHDDIAMTKRLAVGTAVVLYTIEWSWPILQPLYYEPNFAYYLTTTVVSQGNPGFKLRRSNKFHSSSDSV